MPTYIQYARNLKKSQVKSTTEIDYVEQIKGNSTPLGQVTLEILNPKNTEESEADFIGVPNDFSCLLGLNLCKKWDSLP